MQMWRAVVARSEGRAVSTAIAPVVRTASVTSNTTVKAGLKGQPYFGVQSYEPETASAIMALLLVAHVRDTGSAHASPKTALSNPTAAFALDGFSGGIWRAPYTYQSMGPFAVILGYVAPCK